MKTDSYFSPGKLLLTSEYFVLDGALALAVPTILGQAMTVNEVSDSKNQIIWQAFHLKKEWLYLKIDSKNWQILETNIPGSAGFMLKVFKIINDLNPELLNGINSFHFKTNLQFPADFGLGSSSTLMVNLANWAKLDAFVLNEKCLGGSGYDIAVAQEKSAILFKKNDSENSINTMHFNPPFLDDLILIHLNQKQNSREGIELYRSKEKSQKLIDAFSGYTEAVLRCTDLDEFSRLMEIHEAELGAFLGLKTVKDLKLPDCPVFVKSLGAWGGDFILSRKFPNYEAYFESRNFEKIFSWKEIVNSI